MSLDITFLDYAGRKKVAKRVSRADQLEYWKRQRRREITIIEAKRSRRRRKKT